MSRRPALIATAAFLSLTLAAHAAAPIRPPKPLTPGQLDQLTGRIALYPDPLLKQILNASAHPFDVILAAQWLRTHPSPTDGMIAAQPWDPSVQTLAHYPAALFLLADDLAWTQTLGRAYTTQPDDLTKSIQRLRIRAHEVGSLKTSPEQTVVAENHEIEIQPTDPETIYVPVYDPAACYVHPRPPHFERPGALPPPPTPPTVPSTPLPTSPPTVDRGTSSLPQQQQITVDSGDGFTRVETAPQPSQPSAPAAPAPPPTPAPEPAPAPAPAPAAATADTAPAQPHPDDSSSHEPPAERGRVFAR